MPTPQAAKRICLSFQVVGAACFCVSAVDAQTTASPAPPPDYCLEVFEAEHGLPQNVVTAVVQTRDGYLWAGTYTGLARFDGVQFTVFDASITPGLDNSRVTSLFEDRSGVLWIGHETGDVSRQIDGRFELVVSSSKWSGGSVVGIGENHKGEVWVADVLGALLRVKDGYTIRSDRMAGSAWGLSSLATDGDGQLWLTAGEGLGLITNGLLKEALVLNEPVIESAQALAASGDGGIWVAGDALLRKWNEGRWVANLGNPPWGDDAISTMLETRSGTLLVGTINQGLYALAPGSPPVHFSRTNGLPHDWVRAICEDRERNIWVGTGGGLVAMRPRKVVMMSPSDAWQGRAVLGITSGTDGAVWMGTEGAGVYKVEDNQWSQFGNDSGLTNLFVWSVLADVNDHIWAGSWGGGLRVKQGELFDQTTALADLPVVVAALAQARDGDLLVGTSAGLIRYTAGQPRRLTPTNDADLPDVRAIAETSDGSIWFGTSGEGLGRVRDGEVTRFRTADGLPSDFVMALMADEDDTLWIGTLDSGLAYWDEEGFGIIGPEAGLPSSLISGIQDDGQGNLWISSQNGLFRVSKLDLRRFATGRQSSVYCLSYGKPEGMTTVVCAAGFQPSSCTTPDGRMWFPTAKGLAVIDPTKVSRNPIPPPVLIEAVFIDDRPIDLGIETIELETGERVPLITVPPGRQRFEFRFAGLSFTAPERVRFKTLLEGIQDEWTDAGSRRSVNYNFLPHGRYTFRVIASNNDGVWNEEGAVLALRLLPYFWQTLWFQGTLLLLGGVAIALGVRSTTRRRMRLKLEKIERQEAMERERTRIARDIHDDLGASLTRITMLSHTAYEELAPSTQGTDYLYQIYNTARDLTKAMDEIVWAVNPRHDTLDSLVTYLGRYAQQFLSAANIRCRLNVPLQLPSWQLTTEIRHNLFLAFKEALNNTVKHAGAHEVRVSMELGSAHFILVVEDDGRGFNPADKSTSRPGGGNGLRNMQQRLEQMNGQCDIRSEPGRGTTVKFDVTVHC